MELKEKMLEEKYKENQSDNLKWKALEIWNKKKEWEK